MCALHTFAVRATAMYINAKRTFVLVGFERCTRAEGLPRANQGTVLWCSVVVVVLLTKYYAARFVPAR